MHTFQCNYNYKKPAEKRNDLFPHLVSLVTHTCVLERRVKRVPPLLNPFCQLRIYDRSIETTLPSHSTGTTKVMGGEKIGSFSEEHLLNVAKSAVEKKTKGSVVLDVDAEARIPKFHTDGTSPC